MSRSCGESARVACATCPGVASLSGSSGPLNVSTGALITPPSALAAARGNVTEAARALGKGRVQIHRLMRRLNLDAKTFRS